MTAALVDIRSSPMDLSIERLQMIDPHKHPSRTDLSLLPENFLLAIHATMTATCMLMHSQLLGQVRFRPMVHAAACLRVAHARASGPRPMTVELHQHATSE